MRKILTTYVELKQTIYTRSWLRACHSSLLGHLTTLPFSWPLTGELFTKHWDCRQILVLGAHFVVCNATQDVHDGVPALVPEEAQLHVAHNSQLCHWHRAQCSPVLCFHHWRGELLFAPLLQLDFVFRLNVTTHPPKPLVKVATTHGSQTSRYNLHINCIKSLECRLTDAFVSIA